MCAYVHTHTHTLQVGYSDVSPGPGIGTRHLEGPKNSDGLILGKHVFIHVYKVHMYVYAGRRDEILD